MTILLLDNFDVVRSNRIRSIVFFILFFFTRGAPIEPLFDPNPISNLLVSVIFLNQNSSIEIESRIVNKSNNFASIRHLYSLFYDSNLEKIFFMMVNIQIQI